MYILFLFFFIQHVYWGHSMWTDGIYGRGQLINIKDRGPIVFYTSYPSTFIPVTMAPSGSIIECGE